MSTSTNVVVIDGRIGKDPELRQAGGTSFLNFSLAVSDQRKVRDEWQEQTHWIDVKVIGKRAEALGKFLAKGSFCVVSGKLQQETWEKDGQKRSKIVVLAENISLGPKQSGTGVGRPRQSPESAPADDGGGYDGGSYDGGGAGGSDDIPFGPVGDIG